MSATAGAVVRAQAATALAQVLAGRALDAPLAAAATQVATRDRALLAQLCYGCLRWAPRLLAVSEQLLTKPLRGRDRDLLALLLLGLYQLSDTRIPAHAAIGATVQAAITLDKPWAKGLLNGCLRRYQREQQALLQALRPAQLAAHPQWLYEELERQWPAQRDAIIAANNSQPPMTLRVNLGRNSRERYLETLRAAGMAAQPGRLSPAAIVLEQPVPVEELPEFGLGAVSVQDESAQLAALLLQPQAGERVLDACAAPGSKTCHLLEIQPQLELLAVDNDAQRLQRVEQNLARLRLEAQLACMDAAAAADRLGTQVFDRILLDVPCSASGVIRRHPDIKLLREQTDSTQFGVRQLALLTGLWPTLKRDGVLLYVTCSVLAQENDAVVQAFAAAHPGQLQMEPLRLSDTDTLHAQTSAGGLQLLPAVGGGDGLYYARLRKL